jgi:hypothetical protein
VLILAKKLQLNWTSHEPDGAAFTANELKANSIVVTAISSIVKYEPDDGGSHTGGTGTPTKKEKEA